MYNSKISGRLQEIIDNTFVDSNNIHYTVDAQGNLVRDDRFRPQVVAARESLNRAVNKDK